MRSRREYEAIVTGNVGPLVQSIEVELISKFRVSIPSGLQIVAVISCSVDLTIKRICWPWAELSHGDSHRFPESVRGNVGKCLVNKPLSQLTPLLVLCWSCSLKVKDPPVACVFSFLWPFVFRRIELLMYFFMPNLMVKSVCCYLLRFVRKAREALTEGCRLWDAIVRQSERNFSGR